MKTFTAQKKKVLLALAFSLFFLGTGAHAQTPSSVTSADTLYLYNALENKYSIEQLLNNEVELPTESLDPVALAVPPMLSLEEKTRIQEEKVRVDLAELTLKQEKALADAEAAVEKITNKGEWRSTVLGNNLGILEFHLVQVKGIQAALNSLSKKTVDVPLKLQIQDQVEVLHDEQSKIESVLAERNDKFSFIGWLVATI